MHELTTVPVVQIRPNCLLVYNQIINRPVYRKKQQVDKDKKTKESEDLENETLTGKKAYSGDMTKSSIQRLKKAVNTLVAISEWKEAPNWKTNTTFRFKLNFVTLTLPSEQGDTTDKELKQKALDPLLKRLKRKYGLKSYIWKAEKQKNGNLHFHLTTDTYIHYEHLRNEWNSVLTPLGYIEKFRQKHNHSHPNSTDIHATYKVKDLASYLVKYMTKSNDKDATIQGKMWDCSINLKQKIKCATEIDNETHNWLIDTFTEYPGNVREKEWCTFLFLNEKEFSKVVRDRYLIMYDDWRKAVREYERPPRQKESKPIEQQKIEVKKRKSESEQLGLQLLAHWQASKAANA